MLNIPIKHVFLSAWLQGGSASRCPVTTSASTTRRRRLIWRRFGCDPFGEGRFGGVFRQAIAGGKCDYHTLVSCSLAFMILNGVLAE